MSDDLNNKIKQIAEILGQDNNMQDNLKGLLGLLGSSGNKEEIPPKTNDTVIKKEEKAARSELEDNLDLVRKMKKVADKLNSKNDPRVNLLTAIRPFLNLTRQKRLNNCIKLLQMSSLTSFLDENDK
jgi:hypothetical protein